MNTYKRNIDCSASINSGIYCITNTINNKKYIGQTYNLDYRWQRHKFDLRHNYHSNLHLQSAWNKYGESAFRFEIIELCSLDVIDSREIYWIDLYKTKDNGYNQSDGGIGCRGYKHTESEIQKMRAAHNPRPVLQYDESGIFIARWDSVAQASKNLNLYARSIRDCCRRSGYVKSSGGYIWIYEEDLDNNDLSYYLNKNDESAKSVLQFDLNMNLITIWESAYSARSNKFDNGQITAVCNHKQKTYMGYIWRFSESYDEDNYIDDCSVDYSYVDKRKSKVIAQYTPSLELLNTYCSLNEASKQTLFDKHGISDCCNEKRDSFHNFVWKYVI